MIDINNIEKNKYIIKIENELKNLKQKVFTHKLYQNITSIQDIKIFMYMHVFAVWDFMSILKSLQNHLTNINIPWTPTKNTISRRLINEIVLYEESDFDENNNTMSHFEIYLQTMKKLNVNTKNIDQTIENVKQIQKNNIDSKINNNNSILYKNMISNINIPIEIKEFLNFTFDTIYSNQLHKIASIFTFGRENIIPDMFINIVSNISKNTQIDLSSLLYFLNRHIDLDQNLHGPMSLYMIVDICQNDEEKYNQVIQIAKQSLQKRLKLYDSINQAIINNK